MKKNILISYFVALSFLCSCHQNKPEATSSPAITAEMAYEGINNYCHSEYDWSIAADNPSIMSVGMGEETETEYEVVFRSYTGATINFYVDKTSGKTRMVEHAPIMDIEEEIGTIDLLDYLEKEN